MPQDFELKVFFFFNEDGSCSVLATAPQRNTYIIVLRHSHLVNDEMLKDCTGDVSVALWRSSPVEKPDLIELPVPTRKVAAE